MYQVQTPTHRRMKAYNVWARPELCNGSEVETTCKQDERRFTSAKMKFLRGVGDYWPLFFGPRKGK
jgi:hypothetical protein